ncbi:hypothetical protein BTH41_03295 [Bacillus mycoides]|nr:hypothetical protein BTH41_03295 [Bacillus mycoides]
MKKRKETSFILVVIFLIVTNLVLAGFTIQHASQKATDAARKKLGADVELSPDFMGLMNSGKEDEFTPLTEKLAKSKYVKNYNYLLASGGTADGFQYIEPSGSAEDNPMSSMLQGNGNLSLQGVRESGLFESFKNGKSKMVEGASNNEFRRKNIINR